MGLWSKGVDRSLSEELRRDEIKYNFIHLDTIRDFINQSVSAITNNPEPTCEYKLLRGNTLHWTILGEDILTHDYLPEQTIFGKLRVRIYDINKKRSFSKHLHPRYLIVFRELDTIIGEALSYAPTQEHMFWPYLSGTHVKFNS